MLGNEWKHVGARGRFENKTRSLSATEHKVIEKTTSFCTKTAIVLTAVCFRIRIKLVMNYKFRA